MFRKGIIIVAIVVVLTVITTAVLRLPHDLSEDQMNKMPLVRLLDVIRQDKQQTLAMAVLLGRCEEARQHYPKETIRTAKHVLESPRSSKDAQMTAFSVLRELSPKSKLALSAMIKAKKEIAETNLEERQFMSNCIAFVQEGKDPWEEWANANAKALGITLYQCDKDRPHPQRAHNHE